ncbi:MAG: hypothetical protein Q6K99_00620 [Thermostichales cyanobacterium BF4_bins_65]
MTILCTTVTLPWIPDPWVWEQQLWQALGSAAVLRWAISRVEGGWVTVEAVVLIAAVVV